MRLSNNSVIDVYSYCWNIVCTPTQRHAGNISIYYIQKVVSTANLPSKYVEMSKHSLKYVWIPDTRAAFGRANFADLIRFRTSLYSTITLLRINTAPKDEGVLHKFICRSVSGRNDQMVFCDSFPAVVRFQSPQRFDYSVNSPYPLMCWLLFKLGSLFRRLEP